MIGTARVAAALAAAQLAAGCAPADQRTEEAPAANSAAAKGDPDLQVAPVADIDPETGIDRNVTYEPQLGPEPEARPRNEPRKSARGE